jgi:K+:H+ antiporter
VITMQRDEVDRLRAGGVTAIYGDAANLGVLTLAGVETARLVVVAVPDPNETRLIVEHARGLNPGVDLIVRTHSDAEAAHLQTLGPKLQAVHGERELAVQMTRYALRRFGVSATEAEAIAQGLRGRPAAAAPRRRGMIDRFRERWNAATGCGASG